MSSYAQAWRSSRFPPPAVDDEGLLVAIYLVLLAFVLPLTLLPSMATELWRVRGDRLKALARGLAGKNRVPPRQPSPVCCVICARADASLPTFSHEPCGHPMHASCAATLFAIGVAPACCPEAGCGCALAPLPFRVARSSAGLEVAVQRDPASPQLLTKAQTCGSLGEVAAMMASSLKADFAAFKRADKASAAAAREEAGARARHSAWANARASRAWAAPPELGELVGAGFGVRGAAGAGASEPAAARAWAADAGAEAAWARVLASADARDAAAAAAAGPAGECNVGSLQDDFEAEAGAKGAGVEVVLGSPLSLLAAADLDADGMAADQRALLSPRRAILEGGSSPRRKAFEALQTPSMVTNKGRGEEKESPQTVAVEW